MFVAHPDEADQVAALLGRDPHRPLGGLEHVPQLVPTAIERRVETETAHDLRTGAARAHVVRRDDRLAAAAVERTSDWDSDHLGIEVVRCDGIAVEGADRREAAQRLGEQLLTPISDRDRLALVTVSASDVSVLVGLQQAGFVVYDSTLWLAAVPGRAPRRRPERDGEGTLHAFAGEAIRTSSPATKDEVNHLASLAPPLFEASHLFADDRLPRAAVEGIYDHWVRAIFDGSWSDWLLIARHADGSIASFVSYRSSQSPPVVFSASFGFSVPPHRRGFTARLTDCVLSSAPADLVISAVQARNGVQVNGLHRGGLDVIRAATILHGWSG